MADNCNDILRGGLSFQSGVEFTACKAKKSVADIPGTVSDGYDNLTRTAGSAWTKFWHGKDLGQNLKDCNNPSVFAASNKIDSRCIEGS